MDYTFLLELLSYFGSCFVAIFVIIDPFAVTPIYLLLTEKETVESRRTTRRKASFLAFCLLATFALTGMTVFNIFGITMPAFQIAGGILLLISGIEQLRAKRVRVKEDEQQESLEKDDVWIFPLGTPLLAGPGAISTVVLLASKTPTWLHMAVLCVSILGALGVSHLVLKGAPFLVRVMGKTGLNLLTRIMGIILTAIAIQFMLNGISGYLSLLPK